MQTRTITTRIPLKVRTAHLILKPKRGYHTGKAKRNSGRVSDGVFNIESVFCGDGEKRSDGMILQDGVIYASERIDGGLESYWEVDPESLMFTTRGGRRGGNWRTRPLTALAKQTQPASVPRINIPSAKRDKPHWIRKKLREAALRWMYLNKGHALSVGGPGARNKITGVEKHYVLAEGRVYEEQNDGNCVLTAISNAIHTVCGKEIANSVREYFRDESPHFLKFREATPLLHELATGAEMRKLPKVARKAFLENPFAYMANRESGVFVVHVYEPAVTTHTLVIHANRKLIIDSAEPYPMRLSEELLRKYGGDQAKSLRLDEVRMIVKQSESNPNNH